MAARRGTRAGKAAGKGRRTGSAGGRGRRGRPSSGSRRGTRRSARRASPLQSARRVSSEDAGAPELAVVMDADTGRGDAGEVDPSRADGGAGALRAVEEVPPRRADQERAAREARRIEEAAAAISRRREAAEAAPRLAEVQPELPGLTGMAVELLLGGLRLARAVATAPLRLARAFLERAG